MRFLMQHLQSSLLQQSTQSTKENKVTRVDIVDNKFIEKMLNQGNAVPEQHCSWKYKTPCHEVMVTASR